MKKLLATVAVLAVAGSAIAQTTASANIVGYSKIGGTSGLHLVSAQFVSATSNTPTTLFGDSLPYGSKVYQFRVPNGPYNIAEYKAGVFGQPDAWDNTFVIESGEGFWVQVNGTAVATPIVSGEVEIAASKTVAVQAGLQVLSNPYPTDITVKTAGFSPVYGDKIYRFIAPSGPYEIAEYKAGVFGQADDWDNDFTIGVGEGFWYLGNSGSGSWVMNRPFTP